MSVAEVYKLVRCTGCVFGTEEEVKAQLADIAAYLGTKDPIELGAALLLEQAGYKRSQLQLGLEGIHDDEQQESERHVVQLSAEGFQIRNTETGQLRIDVWSSREDAERACEALDASACGG